MLDILKRKRTDFEVANAELEVLRARRSALRAKGKALGPGNLAKGDKHARARIELEKEVEANEREVAAAHRRRAELLSSLPPFGSDWIAPAWLADVNDSGLTPGEALAAMEKPATLVDAEAVLAELWTRREGLGVQIRELSRSKDDDRHSVRGKALAAATKLRAELAAIDEAIPKARIERDALRLPFGDLVVERMKPIGDLAAVRLLQAADDFREAVRTLQDVANINASHMSMRSDCLSKYYGSAITSLPLHSLRDVDLLTLFARRVLGEAVSY